MFKVVGLVFCYNNYKSNYPYLTFFVKKNTKDFTWISFIPLQYPVTNHRVLFTCYSK